MTLPTIHISHLECNCEREKESEYNQMPLHQGVGIIYRTAAGTVPDLHPSKIRIYITQFEILDFRFQYKGTSNYSKYDFSIFIFRNINFSYLIQTVISVKTERIAKFIP